MVQEPAEANHSGNSRPALSAAARAASSVMPASTIIVPVTVSSSRSAARRVRDKTISPCIGVWPPTRPVLPPCGTIAVSVSWHSATTGRDLLASGGPYDGEGPAAIEVAALAQVGRGIGRGLEHVGVADDGAYPGEKIRSRRQGLDGHGNLAS